MGTQFVSNEDFYAKICKAIEM
jgi:preprotein translocase subunit SecA